MAARPPADKLRPRRPRPSPIVAAATRYNLTARGSRQQAHARRSAGWQAEAWQYFDDVPEVKYAAWWLANAFGKLRLQLVAVDPTDPDGDPVSLDDPAAGIDSTLAASAVAEMTRLDAYSEAGLSQALQRINLNFEIPGECWLIGVGPRDAQVDPVTGDVAVDAAPERWMVRSLDEVVDVDGRTWIIDRPGQQPTTGLMLDPEVDTKIRLWVPHGRWYAEADSPMRAALVDCRALVAYSNLRIAEAHSRTSAGLLLVPNQLTAGGDDPADEGAEDDSPLMTAIVEAMIAPIEDPDSPSALAPLLLQGEAEHLNQVRLVPLGRETSNLDAHVEAVVERLARGLNLPVEVVKGHANTTFANAAQIDRDEWTDHLEPRARLVVDALTHAYLHPNLIDSGFDPEQVARIRVWYDPSALLPSREPAEAAHEAFDRGAIGDDTYRRVLGFDDADAPSVEERLMRLVKPASSQMPTEVMVQIINTAIGGGITYTPPEDEAPAEVEAPAPEPEPEVVEAAARAIVAAARPDRYHLGDRLMAIDRQLRQRLGDAASAALDDALRKAGARLRSRPEVRAQVASHVAHDQVAAHLGRSRLAEFGIDEDDLVSDAWSALEGQYRLWAVQSFDDAIGAADSFLGLSTETRTAAKLRAAESIDQAWGWFRQNLTSLASARLYDPSPIALPGEFDPTSKVPTGMVRTALARAGGGARLVTSESHVGAWVVLDGVDGGYAGGVASGGIMRDVFAAEGVGVDGYRWVYGPGFRESPFEPHRALDGVEFVNFDDPALANTGSWPPFSHYVPGDHAGCQCDVALAVLPAASTPRG